MAEVASGRLARLVERVRVVLDRWPWLLPTASFAIGWLSFLLFQRGEQLARVIAAIALIGWPWLLAEHLLARWITQRSRGRLSVSAVRFVTQQIQQEILFFALPFLFGAMQFEAGQILFMAAAACVALLVTLDPIYLHRIAPHAGWSSALHAYCTLIAALVVLPVALHLPLEQAFPLALGFTALTLLASLPRMLSSTIGLRLRLLGCVALASTLGVVWGLRSWIPPAGLWVRESLVTRQVEAFEPGPSLSRISAAQISEGGLIAFVAVRAPTGLAQAVNFEWWHGAVRTDRIAAEIDGGREAGFRTWSRKQNFGPDPRGDWRVDLRTPQGQLIARMRFTVE